MVGEARHANRVFLIPVTPIRMPSSNVSNMTLNAAPPMSNQFDSDIYKLLNPVPYREYREHEADILDIAWCRDQPNLLLSCSLDQKVILWDLKKEMLVEIFEHPDIPTKICFNSEVCSLIRLIV